VINIATVATNGTRCTTPHSSTADVNVCTHFGLLAPRSPHPLSSMNSTTKFGGAAIATAIASAAAAAILEHRKPLAPRTMVQSCTKQKDGRVHQNTGSGTRFDALRKGDGAGGACGTGLNGHVNNIIIVVVVVVAITATNNSAFIVVQRSTEATIRTNVYLEHARWRRRCARASPSVLLRAPTSSTLPRGPGVVCHDKGNRPIGECACRVSALLISDFVCGVLHSCTFPTFHCTRGNTFHSHSTRRFTHQLSTLAPHIKRASCAHSACLFICEGTLRTARCKGPW
jgi:hypothetical protein